MLVERLAILLVAPVSVYPLCQRINKHCARHLYCVLRVVTNTVFSPPGGGAVCNPR